MKLFKVVNKQLLDGLGVTPGDVVNFVEQGVTGFICCEPIKTQEQWKVPTIWFGPSQLEPILDGPHFNLYCSNAVGGTSVPQEANEASTVRSVPSTSTSHDSHYASMAVEPVTISEMMMENEAIPPKARYHAAKAVEYFTRAGRKEGQDWQKEFEKALNHGYRAIHGKWPWEVRDH